MSFGLRQPWRATHTKSALFCLAPSRSRSTHSDHSAVEGEPLGLTEEDGTVCLVGLGCLESGLVLVGVELLALSARVESLESVLLECLHENRLGHLEARVQVQEVLVTAIKLLRRHDGQCAVEIVNAVEEVFGKSLQRKVLGCLNFAFCLLLQVAVLCNLALPLVL
jgi:hypothetical protein